MCHYISYINILYSFSLLLSHLLHMLPSYREVDKVLSGLEILSKVFDQQSAFMVSKMIQQVGHVECNLLELVHKLFQTFLFYTFVDAICLRGSQKPVCLKLESQVRFLGFPVCGVTSVWHPALLQLPHMQACQTNTHAHTHNTHARVRVCSCLDALLDRSDVGTLQKRQAF